MEVDYTEKLNFSDDEENQAAKDKGENWLAFFFFYIFIYSFTISCFYFLCSSLAPHKCFPILAKFELSWSKVLLTYD